MNLLAVHYPEHVATALTADAEVANVDNYCCIAHADTGSFRATEEPRPIERR